MSTINTCPHCSKSPDSTELVRLWDGRDHCRGCVEAVCPGLWEFARGRGWLEDSIPDDRAGSLKEWAKMAGLFYAVLALVAVGFLMAGDFVLTVILVGAMTLVLTLAMLGGLFNVFLARRVLPTVRVLDGVVEVYRPHHFEGKRPLATFSLAETHWHVGHLREDERCKGRGAAIVPNRRVVILRKPRQWKGVTPPNEMTATGSSPEMIRIWQGFLKLAGAPEGK